MKKYRKRPVVVEAMQFTGDNWDEVADFLGETPRVWGDEECAENFLTIVTLEGNHRVSVGDYIIKGVQGEFYPCKPDIFETTYEPVTEAGSGNRGPAKKSLPATEEYDRVRREDAWAGVYTDGTPVRLLPQTVSDAMRDELQDRVYKLEEELRKLRQQYNLEREVYIDKGNTLVVLEDPDFDEAILSGEKNCVVKILDANEWHKIADSYPEYVRIGIGCPHKDPSGPVRKITWMGSVGNFMGKLIVVVCFATWHK
jgi:hypothetical protein